MESAVRRALKGVARGLGYYLFYSLLPLLIVSYLPLPLRGIREAFTLKLASIEVLLVVLTLSAIVEIIDKPAPRGVGETAIYVFYIWLYSDISRSARYEYVTGSLKLVVDLSGVINLVIFYFIGSALVKIYVSLARSMREARRAF